MAEERIVRYKPGEVQRRAGSIVSQANEAWYEQKKQEFSSVQDMMYVTILKQGEILSEMRHRSTGFITRLSHEIGDMEERLNLLADFYEYFREQLPRQDINLQYYLQVCRSIRLISSTWQEQDESIEGLIIEEAVSLISEVSPEKGETPRVLADRLEQRFGIIEKGNKPFAGLSLTSNDLEVMSKRFHEAIQPAFRDFVAKLASVSQEVGVPVEGEVSRSLTERYTLVINITASTQSCASDEELEEVVKCVRKSLAEKGIDEVKINPYYVKR